jgi:dolichol-phosphate mannosyltransferase
VVQSAAVKTIIVVPTYNESENLPELLCQLEALGMDIHVLVVDDNSPDGTGTLAKDMAAQRPWLRVMHRPAKIGLGTAYLDGFRFALDEGYEVIGQMDADLSHDPAHLPAMFRALEEADLVQGSRYVRGEGGCATGGQCARSSAGGAASTPA